MSRRGMAAARSMVCETFSSRVRRETRSSTRVEMGRDGLRKGIFAAAARCSSVGLGWVDAEVLDTPRYAGGCCWVWAITTEAERHARITVVNRKSMVGSGIVSARHIHCIPVGAMMGKAVRSHPCGKLRRKDGAPRVVVERAKGKDKSNHRSLGFARDDSAWFLGCAARQLRD